AQPLRNEVDLPSALSAVGRARGLRADPAALSRGPESARRSGPARVFRRCDLRLGEKGGPGVGPTRRGKGSKIMAVADRAGLPLAIHVEAASPAEVRLVGAVLERRFTEALPQRLIGDKAYDSDPLDQELAQHGIEMIAPNRAKHPKSQDGRPLRRYRRRWKVERLMAWLHNFRRIVTRWEVRLENYLGFVHLGC